MLKLQIIWGKKTLCFFTNLNKISCNIARVITRDANYIHVYVSMCDEVTECLPEEYVFPITSRLGHVETCFVV